MPRGAEDDGWDDDEELEDDDSSTIACPYCRREIHEDSVRCPHCEQYLSDEDRPPPRKRWWIVLGVLLALYAVYRWIAG